MKKNNKQAWPKRDCWAVKGYLVKSNPFERIMWIEKDGILICHVNSLAHAIEQIGALSE